MKGSLTEGADIKPPRGAICPLEDPPNIILVSKKEVRSKGSCFGEELIDLFHLTSSRKEEMKDMFKKLMVSILICLFAVAWGYAAEKGTSKEAKKMVEEAVAYMKANGKEKALQEFNKSGGKFVKGEMYVFAYDMNGVMMAHPVNPKLIGKNLLNEPDSKGKLFRKDIVELAKTKGSGLVDYTYLNPVTKKEESKTTYIQKEGDLIICCGAYK